MNRFLTTVRLSVPVIACISVVIVAVLSVDLAVYLWRYGPYDGSRMKCLAHSTHVDDILPCNQQPFE